MGNVPSANHRIKCHILDLCPTMQCYQNMEPWYFFDLMRRFSNHEVQTRWRVPEYTESAIFFPAYTQVKTCHGKNVYTMFITLFRTPSPTYCTWANKMSYYLHYRAAPSHKEQGSTRICYNSMNLQDSMFSKSSQSQMPTHYMISLPWSTKTG